jgi:hypothetical protein
MKQQYHEARQTVNPKAPEAVPERSSSRPRSRQSPNSRSDSDRIDKAGPRRSITTPCREPSMTQHAIFVGIDVSKDTLDVHVRPQADAFALPNDPRASPTSSSA